jgi:hypothetical protein
MDEKTADHRADPEAGTATVQDAGVEPTAGDKKSLSFYMSVLMLSMIALIVSWDVTALSLALPVRTPNGSRRPQNRQGQMSHQMID